MFSSIKEIKPYVDDFISYAIRNAHYTYLVTEIGCGIASFTPDEIAPMFAKAKDVIHIHLPESFWRVINKQDETYINDFRVSFTLDVNSKHNALV